MNRVSQHQALIGLTVLLLGTTIYFLDRPAEQTVFVPNALSLFHTTPAVFGFMAQSLPTFAHVFAFSLLTIALIGGARKPALAACLSWFSVNAAFELGQHPSVASWLVALLPQWLAHIPVLDRTSGYFLMGTFDAIDIWAAALGAVAAYLVARYTHTCGGVYE